MAVAFPITPTKMTNGKGERLGPPLPFVQGTFFTAADGECAATEGPGSFVQGGAY